MWKNTKERVKNWIEGRDRKGDQLALNSLAKATQDRECLLAAAEAMLAVARNGIAEVEADNRHHYEPALVQINAPLALIQVSLDARKQAFAEVIAAAQKAGEEHTDE